MRFVIIFLMIYSYANASSTKNSQGLWLGTFAEKKLTDNLSYWLETQLRYNLDLGNTSQILYRTGIIQKINDSHSMGYLYGLIQSEAASEHRFTLQHGHKLGDFKSFRFSSRSRIEYRRLETNIESKESAGRFRYLLRADQSSSNDSDGIINNFFLVIWDEVFINLNQTSWNGQSTQDRNRLFIGLKKDLIGSNRMEFGYLQQFIPRESGNVSEHIATVYLFF